MNPKIRAKNRSFGAWSHDFHESREDQLGGLIRALLRSPVPKAKTLKAGDPLPPLPPHPPALNLTRKVNPWHLGLNVNKQRMQLRTGQGSVGDGSEGRRIGSRQE